MNVEYDLLIAFIMAIVTFVLTKSGGTGVGNTLKFTGSLAVILPLAVILLSGIFEMQTAGTNTTAMNAAQDETITSITNWFANALPGAIISDVGGMLAGAVIGVFSGHH